jgi:hypothetical protein
MKAASLLLGLFLCGSALGCGPELLDDGERLPDIFNGTDMPTRRPEVGSLWYYQGTRAAPFCTATLIHERAILTVGHCLWIFNQDCEDAGSKSDKGIAFNVTYLNETNQLRQKSYTLKKWHFLSKRCWPNLEDVESSLGIATLSERVDPKIATPAKLASVEPPENTPMYIWGYGDNDDSGNGSGTKRVGTFPYKKKSIITCVNTFESSLARSGDSGGPTFNAESGGELALVTSGKCGWTSMFDSFVIVPQKKTIIESELGKLLASSD